VKTKVQIESRLRKLRFRYLRKYLADTQKRSHGNCLYNKTDIPLNHERKTELTPTKLTPRNQVTLLVIQPDKPVGYCSYPTNAGSWSGVICDDDDVSKNCKYFTPSINEDESRAIFDSRLQDDGYVLTNFKDVAALQWVLEERAFKIETSFIEKFVLFLSHIFRAAYSFLCLAKIRVFRIRSGLDDN